MSDPISNAQFLAQLFAQPVEAQRRNQDRSVQLAQLLLKRRQDVADMQSADASKRELYGLQAQNQMAMQKYQTDAILKREGLRNEEALGRLGSAQKDTLDRERRKVYAAYIQMNGKKNLSDFKPGEGGIAQIELELGTLHKAALRAHMEVTAKQVKSRAQNLRMLVDDGNLDEQSSQAALAALATGAIGDSAQAAIKMLNSGDAAAGLRILAPADRALYDSTKQRTATQLRILRYKDPQVIDAIRGLRDSQDSMTKLMQGAGGLGADDVRQLSALIPDVEDELGVKPVSVDFTKYLSAKPVAPPALKALTPDPQQTDDEYGGLIGLAKPIVTAPYKFGRWLDRGIRENAKYVPGTLAYLGGGQKLLDQEEAARGAAARNLVALQGRTQVATLPMRETAEKKLRALLRYFEFDQPEEKPDPVLQPAPLATDGR